MLDGYHRANGAIGVRNELLILPSVVCATNTARQIAAKSGGIAIVHQHGCLHVGDDLVHTERELLGIALNPNVGAAVVVSLGCETLGGPALARKIKAAGQQVELVGIQANGGTDAAVEAGIDAVGRLRRELDALRRAPAPADWLAVGLDWPDDPDRPGTIDSLTSAGLRVLEPRDGRRGPEAHTELAAGGAQLIVSRPDPDEAPMGFATVPVIAVGAECELHEALAEDFDLLPAAPAADLGRELVAAVRDHAAGKATAAERRGARDFVLHRLTVTM